MAWSVVENDILHVTFTYGELVYIVRKEDISFLPTDTELVLVTIRKTVYQKFITKPVGIDVIGYFLPYDECTSPTDTTRDGLIIKLNELISHRSDLIVDKNGVFVGQQSGINFIEGANITITAADNPGTDRIDVTIASTGGSGEDPFPKILMLMGG